MGGKWNIPVFLLLFLLLSSSSLASAKVYTNADLKPPAPTLDRNSKVDPVTGKVTESKSRDMDVAPTGKVVSAENRVARAVKKIGTDKTAFAVLKIFLFLIWTACLIDILRNEFRGNNKLIWFVAVTFVPIVGAVLYFFIGARQKKYRFIRDYER